ncbi:MULTISPECIES: hypothetical protein [Rhizobium/Agrobacterium group]|uniref:hypothetical protein n=1 Tax=Rhizobium/Agrobacterium group TaxID=227290 RepID=UPI0022FFCAE7|nr:MULTISPECIES: hypothetical protein [Rhizobium/Agrobacterium group]MDA5633151.1 hypothetical protein [Agrobacterium sp. ST15.16.024]MDF1890921.1 hypothetical protein [Rhizobium rhizogenes]
MNIIDKQHAENLRQALHSLYHSGPDGFEGFLSIVLGRLTGQTFRLAKSGTQRGRDGDSAFDGGATYFEGKRYETSPDKKEIFAKLGDLAIDDEGQVDLWILGATCEVAAQTIADARSFAARSGIGIIALDWSNNDLGALLLATVAADDEAKSFIVEGLKKTNNSKLTNDALAAIDYFKIHPDLPERLTSLRGALRLDDAGLGQAHPLNRAWMEKSFSNKALARAEFGQPLAPLDSSGMAAVPRKQMSELLSAFTGKPKSELYSVIGEEGAGKSWICANTWLDANPSSLLVLCPADELLSPQATNDFDTFLIHKLIAQTGEHHSERLLNRWRRRLKGWKANPNPAHVRITLLIDGLNQPLKNDWSRWLNRAAVEVQSLGGCCVVTTRTAHWNQLRTSLTANITTVKIDIWSVSEVKALLKSRNIDPEKVGAHVLESLRNPRLFSIAVDLLEAKHIEQISELSVGRLIFEHMRKAETTGAAPMSGTEFAELLKKLGEEIIARRNRQEADDLRVFDSATSKELQSVATSRFFAPVPGARLQYEIKSEGLNLGLALFLISSLEREHRNHRSPSEQLETILEPIAALDEVAKVVLIATQIACIEEDSSETVRVTLIQHLVSLQNLPTEDADAFARLAKTNASTILSATKNVHCSTIHYQNAEWLLYALLKHRDDPEVWLNIANHVKSWLSLYSDAPERMMFKSIGRDPIEEVSKEREERRQKIEETVTKLTPEEHQFIEGNLLKTDDWAFDTLHKTAFSLLAGKELKEFAPYFIRWSFSDSIGPAIYAPIKDFRHLVRFNRVDWRETRESLLVDLERLKNDTTSDVGKWARVGVLRATGSVDDAKDAETLASWLTRDKERFEGFSLREKYCSVDPCDPLSTKPENVDSTADEYRDIAPSSLANTMGSNRGDHFFDSARCGVSRFHLKTAVHTHQKFAEDVLARNGLPRREGVLKLLEHSAALTREQALRFLHAGQASVACYKNDDRAEKDQWLTAQYSIMLGIAHLDPDDQLDAIANIQGDIVILDIFAAIRPASESKVEEVLERTLLNNASNNLSAVLGAIQYSKPSLSPRVLEIIADLCRSQIAIVRAQALAIAAFAGDVELLKSATAKWDTRALAFDNDTFEQWHGSSAILQAAKAGFLEIENALDRIHLNHYGFAAQELGPVAARAIAARVDVALQASLQYEQTSNLPEMVTTVPDYTNLGPSLVSLSDTPPQSQEEQWRRVGESTARFDERQKKIMDAFRAFSERLTTADAKLVLEDLTIDGVKAMIAADPTAGERWLQVLNDASDMQLRHLHHVALQLAIAMLVLNKGRATELLERTIDIIPTIRRVSGTAKIPSEVSMLWENADTISIANICKKRLVTRRRDSDICIEVLAASIYGKYDIVVTVIDELILRGEPADICLAITLAGFSEPNSRAWKVIEKFQEADGFVGTAYLAAKTAYEKNRWAKHWYGKLLEANAAHEFWQASVMLIKIVDARFDIWSEATEKQSAISTSFLFTIKREIERRIQKYQKNRKDTLFGEKPPPIDLFLKS